uniref:Putative LOV domain-containing protein n=1 Tax=Zygnemopsis sp. BC-2016 TaxID=1799642 RepID=A0A126WZ94_9VIRI|nr:putative LOV domain-containing protein [Zygnemopsis sp. BC-2016]
MAGDETSQKPQALSLRRRSSSSRRQSMEAHAVPLNAKVAEALAKHEYNFVVSDPRLPEHPIVYASEGFLKMSEYPREEVIGRNCRFLQGPDTDRRTVLEIRDAIREERPCQVKILNYTKSGRPFWNLFHLAPIYSPEDGRVLHFIGVQTEIALSASSDETDMAETNPSETESVKLEEAGEKVAAGAAIAKGLAGATLGSTSPPGGSPGSSRLVQSREETDSGEGTSGDAVAIDGGDGDGAAASSGDLEEEGQQGISEGQLRAALEQEDPPPVEEELQGRVKAAVTAVLEDLTEVAKDRMSASRCMELAESSAAGVVCSSLLVHLTRIQQSFVLADPHLPDNPIVHVSDAFLELTGYSREDVVGRNCRFLQGPGTSQETVQEIRQAVKQEKPCTVRILNYRRDGMPFWNSLHVSPVRRCDGQVAFFCGVQLDITAANEHEPMPRAMGMSGRLKQLSAVGAVRVAVRGLQGAGLRRTSSSFSAEAPPLGTSIPATAPVKS